MNASPTNMKRGSPPKPTGTPGQAEHQRSPLRPRSPPRAGPVARLIPDSVNRSGGRAVPNQNTKDRNLTGGEIGELR